VKFAFYAAEMVDSLMTNNQTAENFTSQILHSLVYFEEFSFAKNKFRAVTGQEYELADALVALDDVLILVQVKERSISDAGDEIAERKWFEKKVIRAATKQIRDSLNYLKSQPRIEVSNERGRPFIFTPDKFREVIKLVIFHGASTLPSDCRHKKFHRSTSGGFIHLVDVNDYLNATRVLRVPEDLIRYFRYRQLMLTSYPQECANLPEVSMVGGYVGEGDDSPPSFESYENLHRLMPDDDTWDISAYLRTLRDHTSHPDYNDDYYAILTEFVRLPRSMWREFKKRLVLCIENASHDKFAQPYRIAYPDRSMGFMLFSPDSFFTNRSDWQVRRLEGLMNFTYLQKFDQKLQKCIGVQVAKDGEFFDIQWCMIDSLWEDDPELRAKLDANSPFRPVSDKNQFSYFLQN
jgi:hypothetical protein